MRGVDRFFAHKTTFSKNASPVLKVLPPPRAVLLGNVGKRTFPKKLGNGNVGKRETLAFLCWKRYETWFWET